jgi:hypothetical protein
MILSLHRFLLLSTPRYRRAIRSPYGHTAVGQQQNDDSGRGRRSCRTNRCLFSFRNLTLRPSVTMPDLSGLPQCQRTPRQRWTHGPIIYIAALIMAFITTWPQVTPAYVPFPRSSELSCGGNCCAVAAVMAANSIEAATIVVLMASVGRCRSRCRRRYGSCRSGAYARPGGWQRRHCVSSAKPWW